MSRRLREAHARHLVRKANDSAVLFMVAVAGILFAAAGLAEAFGVAP